ncbi:MAG TPA: DVUA0089 family protein [Burkholderiales bacterium]|nr:DVUA0089 family protein [Burkholderiales bacterium]
MNRYLRYAVAAAFAAGSMASSVAHAVVEMEPNDSLATAQPLTIDGSVEVTGVVGVSSPDAAVVNDVDCYSFWATEGDTVQVDIDFAMKGMFAGTRAVDTVIAIFAADGTKLRENDDATDVDAGSEATNDSFIVDWSVPATGKYYVGVGSTALTPGFPARVFLDGCRMDSAMVDPNVGNGSYTLTISGVTLTQPPAEPPQAEQPPAEQPPVPPVVEQPPVEQPPVVTPPPPPGQTKKVNIDIRPRHHGVARVYPQADGKIAVAILSSRTFNAMKVDKRSLTFGADGDEASYVDCHREGIDVNRDGRKDLVCRFDNRKAGFDVGDLEGILRGTVDGIQFEGRAPLKVVMKGKKKKHGHHYGHYDGRGRGRD